MRKNGAGFTLIELIIVIVIIGILAAIAVPIMQGIRARAIASEIVTAMGTIREALREYYATNEKYPTTDGGTLLSSNKCNYGTLGLDPNSFNGTYISNNCYEVSIGAGPTMYMYGTITCVIGITSAPKASETMAVLDNTNASLMLLIVSGHIYQQGFSRSGYPEATNDWSINPP